MGNNEKYPFQPDGSGHHLDFVLGFRGWFTCGGQQRFNNCRKRTMSDGKLRFHFELHCHKQEIYFKFKNNNRFHGNDRCGDIQPSQGRGCGAAWMASSYTSASHYNPSGRDGNGLNTRHDIVNNNIRKIFVLKLNHTYLLMVVCT